MMKSLKILNVFVQKAQYLLSAAFVLLQACVPAMDQKSIKCIIPVGV